MKRSQLLTAFVVAVTASVVPAHADLSAHWELHADFDDRSIPGAAADCTFKQENERLSGKCEDASMIGEVKGETVTWRLTLAGTHHVMNFTGRLDDDDTVIVGRFSYADMGDGSFLAIRR